MILFLLLLTFITWFPIVMLYGWVFERLWNWYVAPLGVHPMTFSWSCGLVLLASLLVSRYSPIPDDIDEQEKNAFEQIVWYTLTPLFIFGSTYIFRWWFGGA
jgi:hypothetical protein